MYTGGEEEAVKIICMGLAGDSCYETGDDTRVGSYLSVCPLSARSGRRSAREPLKMMVRLQGYLQ